MMLIDLLSLAEMRTRSGRGAGDAANRVRRAEAGLAGGWHNAAMVDAMKAVVYTRYGPPDVLRLTDVPVPVPKSNEVLVRCRAVSLNRSDWESLLGTPLYSRFGGAFRPRRHILGSDIAGTVEATGSGVTSYQPGNDVYADILARLGGFAEYVCVPERDLAPMPAGMSYEQASALPQSGVIALQGLRDVQPGQHVLVNGAGGGTGMYAIQLAKLAGAEVTAVDNREKLEFMRSVGADHVIDYTRQDWAGPYDRILDLVGTRSAARCARALKPGGRYLFVGGSMSLLLQMLVVGPTLGRTEDKKVRILAVRQGVSGLSTLVEHVQAGRVTTHIDRRFALAEVPEALRWVGEGHAKGKVVVTP
jgi:NADPH:quinone reductase-like Zn-dependent oxidoreductase